MKPEENSRNLLNLTRASSKGYEFGRHLDLSEELKGSDPASLFILTIGILGDYCTNIVDELENSEEANEAMNFSARYFDAFLNSRFEGALPQDVMILAATSYYLAQRPGSSFVLSKKLHLQNTDEAIELLLKWLLRAEWTIAVGGTGQFAAKVLSSSQLVAAHFNTGQVTTEQIIESLKELRQKVYERGTSRQLLFVDASFAIAKFRLRVSSWNRIEEFTDTSIRMWQTTIQGSMFPKELWPSQVMLGDAGIFKGLSGIIQMPTSAGKTRSLEIIIRSAFFAKRARLAIIVAPFKALCHEVSNSLSDAFKNDDVKVGEISDALQLDLIDSIAEIFGGLQASNNVLVFTPEKFLYVLRHQPDLAKHIELVMYDEAHQFDSGARGIIYELLLTEIKQILPPQAQSILVSAVIKNAEPVARWLMGDHAVVVDGTTLFPTARTVAFASWSEELGHLMFFDSANYDHVDYALPQLIAKHLLKKKKPREHAKFFPTKGKDESNDVALYLALTAVRTGPTAIFCGLKTTAENLAERIVDIYERAYENPFPKDYSDAAEVAAMSTLIGENFGFDSRQYFSSALGVFVHHGNTPEGIRHAIEYGMQTEKLKFVICTSTLAQGVNLPIRYLIVSSIHQAGVRLKTRDFLNLVGRAGRAGMHTEGLIIFADPEVFDKRIDEPYWFDMSTSLLDPQRAEHTTSSLLELIAPLQNVTGRRSLPVEFSVIAQLLVSERGVMEAWAQNIQRTYHRQKFTSKSLVHQLNSKKKLMVAIETFLMSNRGAQTTAEFKAHSQNIAESSLAYSLANERQKIDLRTLFDVLATNVELTVPSHAKQMSYSKTLLGSAAARYVENWVVLNNNVLLSLSDERQWLSALWPLFEILLDHQFFHTIAPREMPFDITIKWMQGDSYGSIIKYCLNAKATKQWGEQGRRAVTETDILDFLESTITFDCALLISAVVQFLFGHDAQSNDAAKSLLEFQKSMKNGLRDPLALQLFEFGFVDRVISQKISALVKSLPLEPNSFRETLRSCKNEIGTLLDNYPSYYKRPFQKI